MLKCFYIDLVDRISSERNIKKIWDIQIWVLWSPLGDVLRTFCRRPKSTSCWCPLNFRLWCPLNFVFRRLLDVRSGRPWDGQIGSLGDIVGTNINWLCKETLFCNYCRSTNKASLNKELFPWCLLRILTITIEHLVCVKPSKAMNHVLHYI